MRTRTDYSVTVYTATDRHTWLETARDAKGAIAAARRHAAGAVGVEVRRPGFTTPVASWGDVTARPARVAGGAA